MNRAFPLQPALNSLMFVSVSSVHGSLRVSEQNNLQASRGLFRCSFATVKKAAEKEAFSCQHFQTNNAGSIQLKPYRRKLQQPTCWSQDSHWVFFP